MNIDEMPDIDRARVYLDNTGEPVQWWYTNGFSVGGDRDPSEDPLPHMLRQKVVAQGGGFLCVPCIKDRCVQKVILYPRQGKGAIWHDRWRELS